MRVSLAWLRDFVAIDRGPRELADALIHLGLEVSSIDEEGAGLEHVVVGDLLSVSPHPNADRLTVCEVSTGDARHRIVCGANNMKPGDRVALALPGAVLPGGLEIRKSKIRGEVSEGMMCSGKELGIEKASEGILILPPEAPVGKPLASALGRDDTLLEIDLTPNRADCFSHLGVAREVAAITGAPLRAPKADVSESGEPAASLTSVDIEHPARCPRYVARLVRGVTIGPSPAWLASRLEKMGLRPINNVVDVTNYVLFELGQPLHAFDFARLEGGRIVVRCAREGERLLTLDGVERTLSADDLAICDASSPIALAGVMGGQATEVTGRTKDILLESAFFEPSGIRRTSRRHGLRTEASHRFERGADPEMVARAADRAAALIAQVAGGAVAPGAIDVYPAPAPRPGIRLDPSRSNAILGIDLSAETMVDLLRRVGIEATLAAGAITATPPSWRPDLALDVDLVEEIARLHGYDRIPVTLPAARIQAPEVPPERRMEAIAREALTALGYHEAITYRFISPGWGDRLRLAPEDPRRRIVRLRNPPREEQSAMRTSLVPGLLETGLQNFRRGQVDLRLFEVGKVFFRRSHAEGSPAAGDPGAGLPEERLAVAMLLSGAGEPGFWGKGRPADFHDARGVAEALLERAGMEGARFAAEGTSPFLHPGASARVLWEKGVLGEVGKLHPEVATALELPENVYVLELDASEILRASTGRDRVFRALPRFPGASRDMAVVVDERLEAARLVEAVRAIPDKGLQAALREIGIFDVYRGEGIEEGKKSVGLRLSYQAEDRTLTDAEVSAFQETILLRLSGTFGAGLRT